MKRLLYLALLSLVAGLLLVPTAGAQDEATGARGETWLLIVLLANAGAGLVGGLTSAYMINNRSLLSETEIKNAGLEQSKGSRLSSYVGNGLLGCVAAGVFWAGYGANSTAAVNDTGTLTYISLATSFFIGMGGTKWLQSERDKGRWQAAAGSAALAKTSPELQLKLSLASSDQAPQIAAAAAFDKYSSARSSRVGGGGTAVGGANGPAGPQPREDPARSITPTGQGGATPAGRGETVRAIGKSSEQAGGSG